MFRLLTAVIEFHDLDHVKDARRAAGVAGMTVAEAPCDTSETDKVLELVAGAARTGKVRDGQVSSSPVDGVLRVLVCARGAVAA